MDTEDLFTEEEDIRPEDVKEFLEEQSNEPAPGEIPADILEMLEEDNTPKEPSRVEIEPDHTYEANKRDLFENMVVNVRDVDVPITEDDKALYLKGLLHAKPVELVITAKNGVSGKCRTISVYESDVAAGALSLYLEKYPSTAIGFYDSLLQQYRIALQLVEFCGRPVSFLSYERGVNGTKEDHIKDLYEKSQAVLDVPGPVYGMYVRLTNVFQYKIARLQEAAFNSDFWDPADTD